MTKYLEAFKNGSTDGYTPALKELDLGVECIAPLTVPAEDRNRTSPFPFGGHRFEFRAVGSSQNVSLVNTVLAAMMAHEFQEIAERVEKGENAVKIAQDLLKAHFKCVYNGNGYDPSWPE